MNFSLIHVNEYYKNIISSKENETLPQKWRKMRSHHGSRIELIKQMSKTFKSILVYYQSKKM